MGHAVASLHGGMPQGRRNRVLQGLRSRQLQVLVATDVAARGIDVPTISHVINYGLPMKAEDYVHRIGRTGRAGRDGLAVTLAERMDAGMIRRIQQFTTQTHPAGHDRRPGAEEPRAAHVRRRAGRRPRPFAEARRPGKRNEQPLRSDGGRSATRTAPARVARGRRRRAAVRSIAPLPVATSAPRRRGPAPSRPSRRRASRSGRARAASRAARGPRAAPFSALER